MDSNSVVDCDAYFQRAPQNNNNTKVTEACGSLLFAATSLHAAVRRCLTFEGLNVLTPAFSRSTSCCERLMLTLEQQQEDELVKTAIASIRALKELCNLLRQHSSTIVQTLDVKFARHLLVMIHTTAVDIKETAQALPIMRHTASTPTSKQTLPMRGRSHSEHTTTPTMTSPLSSPSVDDRSQLYNHLKLTVTHSLHVTTLLKQSIEETLATDITSVLATKLRDLARQAQDAAERAVCLDKNLQAVAIDHTASRKGFWQDTNEYLKVMVSVMSSVRSISTEEDFSWPKAVKQGCLQVTRVTAEVAKLWNNCSAFADDGYYLGKKDSASSPRRATIPSAASSETLNAGGDLSSSTSSFSSDNNMHNTTSNTNTAAS
ncbi:hypothetical protein BJV82DRAFT_579029 [Fennellomyces sp. T-0311]|nr:hypothetical protein BJV82DRAFT_579029 [Fennellomyces sp. T-0311]